MRDEQRRHTFSVDGTPAGVIDLRVVTRAGRYRIARLALLLSAPALATGALVPPPWPGTAVLRDRTAGSASSAMTVSAGGGGAGAVARHVRECIGGHDRVAAVFTGSPAAVVLLHHAAAACRADGRDLLVLVPERVGHDGRSLAIASTPLLATLAPRADIQVLETEAVDAATAWRPAMPAIVPDEVALPAAVEAAHAWSAGVVLAPDFTGPLARRSPASRFAGGDVAAGALVVAEPHRRAVADRSVAWLARQRWLGRRGRLTQLRAVAADRLLIGVQPWFDRAGTVLPPVEVPLLAPALVGGALAPMLPPSLRSLLPPAPLAPIVARSAHVLPGELDLAESVGLLDPRCLPLHPGALPIPALRALNRWLHAARCGALEA